MMKTMALAAVLSSVLLAAATGQPATFSCGAGCTAQIEPWCKDSLRVRMYVGAAPIDDAEGALQANALCSVSASAPAVAELGATSIINGGISASWADSSLKFSHVGSGGESAAPFLASAGPISSAFKVAAHPIAPPPPPPPGKYACQDSCTLGTTGIKEKTDADGCVALSKLVNVTRDACCAKCNSLKQCQAWAWGRDSADKDHRHNCYLCKGLSGTRKNPDRDFGCIERTAVVSGAAGAAGSRTNFSYHSLTGVFESTPDEV